MKPFLPLSVVMPEDERDATGLTDRAYLDVLGRCVSAGIAAWLLLQLVVLDAGAVSLTAFLVAIPVFTYFFHWLTELMRQTHVYAGTWRYGGPI